MPIKRPIKNNEGKLKEFENTDELPNQPDIEELRYAFALLIFELNEQGIEFESEEINKFLKLIE